MPAFGVRTQGVRLMDGQVGLVIVLHIEFKYCWLHGLDLNRPELGIEAAVVVTDINPSETLLKL
jgi:hypothetical protein